jgi:hypothetical protein
MDRQADSSSNRKKKKEKEKEKKKKDLAIGRDMGRKDQRKF